MGNPVSELQQLTNKSIIELFSVELKADVHYTKVAKTAAYSQSGQTITITLNSHGFSAGLVLSLILHLVMELMGFIQFRQLQQILLQLQALLHSQQLGTFLLM